MVCVDAFHDDKREFVKKYIQLANINAMDPETVVMYGPHGEHVCHKVWMVGYWFWTSETSYAELTSKLKSE